MKTHILLIITLIFVNTASASGYLVFPGDPEPSKADNHQCTSCHKLHDYKVAKHETVKCESCHKKISNRIITADPIHDQMLGLSELISEKGGQMICKGCHPRKY